MKKILVMLVLVASPVAAQEATPQVRALSDKLLAEFRSGLDCDASKIALQDRVKELEAKLAASEKKPDAK